MKVLKFVISALFMLVNLLLSAQQKEPQISLVTCFPGPEVYELCGHTGIRVVDSRGDRVWNYGMFDFNSPNFIGRFVKGETDYYTAAIPTEAFLYPYSLQGRKVIEQTLNLTAEEKKKMIDLLNNAIQPENSVYRYNYVLDNCATRPLAVIDEATGKKLSFPQKNDYGTFRKEMKSFHTNYPWYQFGIDLVLGSGLDRSISPREEMFVPIVLSQRIAEAARADGSPLVTSTQTLVEGKPEAILSPAPWYLTPMCWSIVAALTVVFIAVIDIRRKKITSAIYFLWFLVQGLAGSLVAFLVFCSSHEATSPNMLLLWLNPLALIVPALIFIRKLRGVVAGYMILEFLSIIFLFLSIAHATQRVNPAVIPLLAATAVLAAAYTTIYRKFSYNKEPAKKKPARKAKKSRRKR